MKIIRAIIVGFSTGLITQLFGNGKETVLITILISVYGSLIIDELKKNNKNEAK